MGSSLYIAKWPPRPPGPRAYGSGGRTAWAKDGRYSYNNPMSFDLPSTAARGNTVYARGSTWKNQLDRYDPSRGEFAAFWKGVAAVDVSFQTMARGRHTGASPTILSGSVRAMDPNAGNLPSLHCAPTSRTGRPMAGGSRSWGTPRINHTGSLLLALPAGPREAKPGDALEQGVPRGRPTAAIWSSVNYVSRHSDADMFIRLLDLKTGTETILPESKGKWTPRWSPDGQYIVAVAANSESAGAVPICQPPLDQRGVHLPFESGSMVSVPVFRSSSRSAYLSERRLRNSPKTR